VWAVGIAVAARSVRWAAGVGRDVWVERARGDGEPRSALARNEADSRLASAGRFAVRIAESGHL